MTPEQKAQDRKRRYQPGLRLRLLRFAVDSPTDDNKCVPAGTDGTIIMIDDLGTLHMRWDNGATLGLTVQDHFEPAPESSLKQP